MAKLNNTRQIRSEDFDQEYADLISRLGSILNSFMQEVVELSDERIDFENRVENIVTFTIKVDANGNPIQAPFKLNTGKSGIRGIQVIRAYNLNSANIYPTQQPFINFVPNSSNLITIQNVLGLSANDNWQITAIIY